MKRRAALAGAKSRKAPEDLDWSSYQKYDAFRDLLTSSPLLKVSWPNPLQVAFPGLLHCVAVLLLSLGSSFILFTLYLS